ncbi:MAG: hypothetical protein NTX63_03965 [Candidatus Peregrinibacteria bacterium]|nr:hypothetical protein [Candidatus Peregrinibacteria bacterium]
MAGTINSLSTFVAKTDVSPRQHTPLSMSIVARVLASGMALSSALSGCASSEDDVLVSFAGVSLDGGSGDISLAQDGTATDTAGDATTTTDSESANMAGDVSATMDAADAVDTAAVKETSDTGADIAMSETSDTVTPADTLTSAGQDVIVAADSSVVDAGAVDAGTTPKPDIQSSETTPSSPKEICEGKKAAIIATLKSGAPECTGTIPGVGKVAGELVCDGTNLEPNCIVK